jgi:hypothetical protein
LEHDAGDLRDFAAEGEEHARRLGRRQRTPDDDRLDEPICSLDGEKHEQSLYEQTFDQGSFDCLAPEKHEGRP